MKNIRALWLVLGGVGLVACQPGTDPAPSVRCQPLGYDKAALMQLRTENFEIQETEQRQRFALALTDCLGDPDPVLRDQVAYEGLATLLRGQQLSTETIEALRSSLIDQMANPDPGGNGFRRPFAALALSEVARADRIDPVFSADQRAELVAAGTAYMRGISDYRGFDENEGWRHGVAHDADLLMQLALNPALDRTQLLDIRDAIATQIAPPGTHFYVYGESKRLSRPILFVAMRGVITEQEWADWFDRLASPAPFADWGSVYTTQAGLAKLHNTRDFAEAIYVSAMANEEPTLAPLGSGALNILTKLR